MILGLKWSIWDMNGSSSAHTFESYGKIEEADNCKFTVAGCLLFEGLAPKCHDWTMLL